MEQSLAYISSQIKDLRNDKVFSDPSYLYKPKFRKSMDLKEFYECLNASINDFDKEEHSIARRMFIEDATLPFTVQLCRLIELIHLLDSSDSNQPDQRCRNFIIKGTACSGKSTELKNIIAQLESGSDKKRLFPIFSQLQFTNPEYSIVDYTLWDGIVQGLGENVDFSLPEFDSLESFLHEFETSNNNLQPVFFIDTLDFLTQDLSNFKDNVEYIQNIIHGFLESATQHKITTVLTIRTEVWEALFDHYREDLSCNLISLPHLALSQIDIDEGTTAIKHNGFHQFLRVARSMLPMLLDEKFKQQHMVESLQEWFNTNILEAKNPAQDNLEPYSLFELLYDQCWLQVEPVYGNYSISHKKFRAMFERAISNLAAQNPNKFGYRFSVEMSVLNEEISNIDHEETVSWFPLDILLKELHSCGLINLHFSNFEFRHQIFLELILSADEERRFEQRLPANLLQPSQKVVLLGGAEAWLNDDCDSKLEALEVVENVYKRAQLDIEMESIEEKEEIMLSHFYSNSPQFQYISGPAGTGKSFYGLKFLDFQYFLRDIKPGDSFNWRYISQRPELIFDIQKEWNVATSLTENEKYRFRYRDYDQFDDYRGGKFPSTKLNVQTYDASSLQFKSQIDDRFGPVTVHNLLYSFNELDQFMILDYNDFMKTYEYVKENSREDKAKFIPIDLAWDVFQTCLYDDTTGKANFDIEHNKIKNINIAESVYEKYKQNVGMNEKEVKNLIRDFVQSFMKANISFSSSNNRGFLKSFTCFQNRSGEPWQEFEDNPGVEAFKLFIPESNAAHRVLNLISNDKIPTSKFHDMLIIDEVQDLHPAVTTLCLKLLNPALEHNHEKGWKSVVIAGDTNQTINHSSFEWGSYIERVEVASSSSSKSFAPTTSRSLESLRSFIFDEEPKKLGFNPKENLSTKFGNESLPKVDHLLYSWRNTEIIGKFNRSTFIEFSKIMKSYKSTGLISEISDYSHLIYLTPTRKIESGHPFLGFLEYSTKDRNQLIDILTQMNRALLSTTSEGYTGYSKLGSLPFLLSPYRSETLEQIKRDYNFRTAYFDTDSVKGRETEFVIIVQPYRFNILRLFKPTQTTVDFDYYQKMKENPGQGKGTIFFEYVLPSLLSRMNVIQTRAKTAMLILIESEGDDFLIKDLDADEHSAESFIRYEIPNTYVPISERGTRYSKSSMNHLDYGKIEFRTFDEFQDKEDFSDWFLEQLDIQGRQLTEGNLLRSLEDALNEEELDMNSVDGGNKTSFWRQALDNVKDVDKSKLPLFKVGLQIFSLTEGLTHPLFFLLLHKRVQHGNFDREVALYEVEQRKNLGDEHSEMKTFLDLCDQMLYSIFVLQDVDFSGQSFDGLGTIDMDIIQQNSNHKESGISFNSLAFWKVNSIFKHFKESLFTNVFDDIFSEFSDKKENIVSIFWNEMFRESDIHFSPSVLSSSITTSGQFEFDEAYVRTSPFLNLYTQISNQSMTDLSVTPNTYEVTRKAWSDSNFYKHETLNSEMWKEIGEYFDSIGVRGKKQLEISIEEIKEFFHRLAVLTHGIQYSGKEFEASELSKLITRFKTEIKQMMHHFVLSKSFDDHFNIPNLFFKLSPIVEDEYVYFFLTCCHYTSSKRNDEQGGSFEGTLRLEMLAGEEQLNEMSRLLFEENIIQKILQHKKVIRGQKSSELFNGYKQELYEIVANVLDGIRTNKQRFTMNYVETNIRTSVEDILNQLNIESGQGAIENLESEMYAEFILSLSENIGGTEVLTKVSRDLIEISIVDLFSNPTISTETCQKLLQQYWRKVVGSKADPEFTRRVKSKFPNPPTELYNVHDEDWIQSKLLNFHRRLNALEESYGTQTHSFTNKPVHDIVEATRSMFPLPVFHQTDKAKRLGSFSNLIANISSIISKQSELMFIPNTSSVHLNPIEYEEEPKLLRNDIFELIQIWSWLLKQGQPFAEIPETVWDQMNSKNYTGKMNSFYNKQAHGQLNIEQTEGKADRDRVQSKRESRMRKDIDKDMKILYEYSRRITRRIDTPQLQLLNILISGIDGKGYVDDTKNIDDVGVFFNSPFLFYSPENIEFAGNQERLYRNSPHLSYLEDTDFGTGLVRQILYNRYDFGYSKFDQSRIPGKDLSKQDEQIKFYNYVKGKGRNDLLPLQLRGNVDSIAFNVLNNKETNSLFHIFNFPLAINFQKIIQHANDKFERLIYTNQFCEIECEYELDDINPIEYDYFGTLERIGEILSEMKKESLEFECSMTKDDSNHDGELGKLMNLFCLYIKSLSSSFVLSMNNAVQMFLAESMGYGREKKNDWNFRRGHILKRGNNRSKGGFSNRLSLIFSEPEQLFTEEVAASWDKYVQQEEDSLQQVLKKYQVHAFKMLKETLSGHKYDLKCVDDEGQHQVQNVNDIIDHSRFIIQPK